jgi:sigma-B regulation protein RsbU (phosphoserine phosphatase)
VVADVSGKGVSSALLASFLQGAFLLASDSAGQIPSMMGRMNRYLLERTKGEKYATVFYGIVERNGVLHSSNAGHCAPMVVQRDGRVTTLATTGLPIGMLEEAQYALEELRLAAGDKIVIYSDGLTEAQDPEDQFFGLARLRKVLEANAGRSCAEIHQEILSTVDAFAEGTMLADDVTVVVIEYAADVI